MCLSSAKDTHSSHGTNKIYMRWSLGGDKGGKKGRERRKEKKNKRKRNEYSSSKRNKRKYELNPGSVPYYCGVGGDMQDRYRPRTRQRGKEEEKKGE